MSNKNLQTKKIGLIGLGQQMQCELVPALLKHNNVYEVVAICDTNRENIEIIKTYFPKASTYTDYRELLNIEMQIRDVIVCLPHYLYIEVVTECLVKGFNVFKEKPLAKNFKESKEIFRISKTHGKKVYTVTKRDFYPAYIRGKELLKELGEIYQYVAKHYVTGGNIHEGWKSNKFKSGGGAVINLGYHLLKVLIDYFGEIQNASMCSSNKGKEGFKYEVEDAVTALISHKDGVYGSFQFNCYTGVKQETIEIHGTKGTMIISKTEITIYSTNGTIILKEDFKNDSVKATEHALNEFQIVSEKDTQNIEENLKIMKSIDKLYKNNIFIIS